MDTGDAAGSETLAGQARARWAMAAGVAATVALLTTVVLFREFHGGLLTGLLPWDDCAIFDQALQRLVLIARSGSLFDMALQAKSLAPHGPVADIQAILGLLISGGQTWGPYALNGVLIFGATAVVADELLRRRGPLVAATATALLLFQPLTLYSLMTLKADWKSGFFMACAMLLFSLAAERREGRSWTSAYVLLALAIVAKLTAFYLPVCAILVIVGFRAVALSGWDAPQASRGWFAGQWAELLRGWRSAALGAVAVCLPFVAFFAWGSVSNYNILNYIRSAMSSTWTDGLTYAGRAGFYMPGHNPVWGLLPLEAAVLLAACAVFCVRGANWRPLLSLGVVAGLALLLFAPLVVADGANIEFSGTFVGTILGATLVALCAVPQRLSLWPAAGLVPLLVFTPLGGVDDVLMNPVNAPPVAISDRYVSRRVYEQVAQDIVSTSRTRDPQVRLFFEDSIAGFPNLSIQYFRLTARPLSVTRVDDLPMTPERPGRGVQDEFFVTMAPAAPGVEPGFRLAHRFNASRDYLGSDRYVQALPGAVLVRTYPWGHGELRLYRRPAG